MMRHFTGKRLVAALFASAGIAALAAGSAQAGGFGSRLGSANGSAQAWAGSAAPGLGIGGISVNPALVTSVDGVNFESGAAGVLPDGRLSTPVFSATSAVPAVAAGTAASATALGGPTGQFGTSVLAGGTYFNAQLSKDWYVGVSVTSPYGLGVNYGNTNGLSPDRTRARITTVDVQPVIGYKINDQLSIGFGAQFQWINLTFEQSLGLGSPGIGQVTGQDVGIGFSAGLTYEPFKGTKLGIGYRSSIDQHATATQSFSTALNVPLNGGFVRLPGTPGSFFVTIDQTLPETVTASIRQEFSDRLAVSLTGEWTNWRRVKTLVLGGSPTGTNLPLNFKDGWFVSGGIEYKVDPQWTLRGGIGYDFSPVTGHRSGAYFVGA